MSYPACVEGLVNTHTHTHTHTHIYVCITSYFLLAQGREVTLWLLPKTVIQAKAGHMVVNDNEPVVQGVGDLFGLGS